LNRCINKSIPHLNIPITNFMLSDSFRVTKYYWIKLRRKCTFSPLFKLNWNSIPSFSKTTILVPILYIFSVFLIPIQICDLSLSLMMRHMYIVFLVFHTIYNNLFICIIKTNWWLIIKKRKEINYKKKYWNQIEDPWTLIAKIFRIQVGIMAHTCWKRWLAMQVYYRYEKSHIWGMFFRWTCCCCWVFEEEKKPKNEVRIIKSEVLLLMIGSEERRKFFLLFFKSKLPLRASLKLSSSSSNLARRRRKSGCLLFRLVLLQLVVDVPLCWKIYSCSSCTRRQSYLCLLRKLNHNKKFI